MIHSSFPP
uniref:Uncharacterized protein n=1 Tax=Oryza barthii TaxID=65489 RepID=A0A0G2KBM4_9ORYZ